METVTGRNNRFCSEPTGIKGKKSKQEHVESM